MWYLSWPYSPKIRVPPAKIRIRRLPGISSGSGMSELRFHLARVQRQDLDVLGDAFVQHEAVRPDPDRRPHRLHLDVAVVADLERHPVLPQEAEHLLAVAQHRVVVVAAVHELLVEQLPGSVRVRAARLLDAVAVEVAQQRAAIVVFALVGHDLAVDGEQRGQIVGEPDVGRRAVVDGADRHGEEVSGDPRPLLDHDAAVPLAVGDRTDLRQSLQPDVEERVHHRGDQQLPARMLLLEFRHAHVVLARRQLDRAPQRLPADGRDLGAHLLGQPQQHRSGESLALEMPGRDQLAVAADLEVEQRADHVGQREQRQQRHDVGEPLVEGRLIGRRRLQVSLAQSVEDGVGGLVRDHVMRQAGVDRLSAGTLEVAEEYPPVVPGVERVRIRERVRGDMNLMAVRAPGNAAAERELELRQTCA